LWHQQTANDAAGAEEAKQHAIARRASAELIPSI
jgi:hypothetical protein